MASVAAERPVDRAAGGKRAGRRGVLLLAVAAILWGLWEGFLALGTHFAWQHPFPVEATTMPHIHDMIRALFERPNAQGPLLAHSRALQRGFLPYVVASQTVPILAIAPMVVIWLGSVHVTAWISVAVIAAYLTFFPVVIATLRGLHAADRQAVELMRSYAANRWTVLWKLRFPTSLPYLFSALRISATASIVGAIIGESPSSIAGGLGGAILNFAQYYTFQPQNLWATNIVAAALGVAFFLVVVAAEKLVVRRAPEHVA
jgi:NitT/TauT family transport system permease protein